jgi:hypothetical protein
MIQVKKQLTRFLLIVTVSSIIVQLVNAATMNFTVHGGEEVTRSISLVVEDHVSIKGTVLGQSDDNTLLCYMTYPNGTVKENFGKTGNLDYGFVCDLEGEYVLHFSNNYSSEDKLVTLDYEVQHYIFGIPQMLFLTIIIVVVCVAAVATFILMGKPR